MKYLYKFTNFLNEAFLHGDKKKAIDAVLSYLKNKSNMDFYEYDETWHIQKGDVFLDGQLFISLKSSKAIRFNWKNGDISSVIHSIDVWDDFSFDKNPSFTLSLEGVSVVKVLPEIANFVKSPSSMVKEELDTDGYDPNKELQDAVKRLKRLKSPKSIDAQKKKIEKLQAAIAYDERAEIESEKINQLDDDLKIDVFKSIEL